MTNAPTVALITGASSGIGALYADRLARRGWNLILVARSADRLDELAARIRRETGTAAEALVADLEQPEDQRQIADRLLSDPAIEMFVNNAGFGSTAPMLEADPEVMARMIALNAGAAARLAQAAAIAFAPRGRGAIVNIASIAALAPAILNGVYAGSKAFLLTLSQSLQHELAPRGVRVQAVLPGATATDFWQRSGTEVHALPPEIVMRAEDVVDAALAGLDQGEPVTIPSLPDAGEWDRLDAMREALLPYLSRSAPARRYGLDRASASGE